MVFRVFFSVSRAGFWRRCNRFLLLTATLSAYRLCTLCTRAQFLISELKFVSRATHCPVTLSPRVYTRDSFEGEWKNGTIQGQGILIVLPHRGWWFALSAHLFAHLRVCIKRFHAGLTKNIHARLHACNAHAQALFIMQMVAYIPATGIKTGQFVFSICASVCGSTNV